MKGKVKKLGKTEHTRKAGKKFPLFSNPKLTTIYNIVKIKSQNPKFNVIVHQFSLFSSIPASIKFIS